MEETSSIFSSDAIYASCESDENIKLPFYKLLKALSSFYLECLSTIFKEKIKRNDKKELGLTKTEFVDAISEIFADANYASEAILLFNDINKDENMEITWTQFLDYLLSISQIKTSQKLELGCHHISAVPHVMRDAIAKIVLIESEKYFCYAVISKYGRVGIYDGNMNFLTSYHVLMTREDLHRTEEEKRRRNRWITDAAYLPDISMFIVANSTRSFTIYDASSLKHVALWLLIGFPNLITSVVYHCEQMSEKSILFIGDELGTVTSLTFLKTKTNLLRQKREDKLTIFYWTEMPDEKEYVLVKTLFKNHKENIRQIRFLSDKNTLVTCSRDASSSVVMKHLANKRKPYVFSMRRGCSCFSLGIDVLVTGSDDGTVRIWNTVITSKPRIVLKDHLSGIVDVALLEILPMFLTCSRDGVIKLWNLKEERCVQTKKLSFPPFKIAGKSIEWGTNSLYPGPKRQKKFDLSEKFINKPIETDDDLNNNITKNFTQTNDLWFRSNILITCCSYVASIEMVFSTIYSNFNSPVLQPPPLQNSVLIPSMWNKYSRDFNIPTYSTATETDETEAKYTERLKFILEKDLLYEKGSYHDINRSIAQLEQKKAEMRESVERCAPFLATNLQEVTEIKLNPQLPQLNRKSIRKLVESTRRMLSAASTRSQIFSESSTSSKTRSTRSSIVEFDY